MLFVVGPPLRPATRPDSPPGRGAQMSQNLFQKSLFERTSMCCWPSIVVKIAPNRYNNVPVWSLLGRFGVKFPKGCSDHYAGQTPGVRGAEKYWFGQSVVNMMLAIPILFSPRGRFVCVLQYRFSSVSDVFSKNLASRPSKIMTENYFAAGLLVVS